MDLLSDDLPSPARAEQEKPDANRGRALRLVAAAHDLLALAHELDQRTALEFAPCDPPLPAPVPRTVTLARRYYRERRLRGQIFADETLFGEPAWDLLLDLYIAACEGKRTPVTSACIGAAVPNTTALRWLSILEKRGLIEREADASDARRYFVRLTLEAQDKMTRYFERACASSENGRPSGEERPFMLVK